MTSHATARTTRDTIAEKLTALTEADRAELLRLMDFAEGDDLLIDGVQRYLDLATAAKFLNSMKLEERGSWIGSHAPARLQMRLTEAARSSQHPAYLAFRTGLQKSGGLARAFPKA